MHAGGQALSAERLQRPECGQHVRLPVFEAETSSHFPSRSLVPTFAVGTRVQDHASDWQAQSGQVPLLRQLIEVPE